MTTNNVPYEGDGEKPGDVEMYNEVMGEFSEDVLNEVRLVEPHMTEAGRDRKACAAFALHTLANVARALNPLAVGFVLGPQQACARAAAAAMVTASVCAHNDDVVDDRAREGRFFQTFLDNMMRKLMLHKDKGGWDSMSAEYLRRRAVEEWCEMVEIIDDDNGSTDDILDEAADVANFMMMLWDNDRKGKTT